MTRKSESNIIVNKKKYKKILPEYLELIDSLDSEFKSVIEESIGLTKLVNFKDNYKISKHNWFAYKQGYSSVLVEKILKEENPPQNTYVIDPFTGVGTTNLVANKLGYNSIGFDINPVATLAANVKTTNFSSAQINHIKSLINNFDPKESSTNIPSSSLMQKAFTSDVFEKLMKIKGFYETIEDKKIQSFFKLAYLSIIEDCSNRVKDGNGIKIAKNKKQISNIFEYYNKKCGAMISDLDASNKRTKSFIINASITNKSAMEHLRDKPVGLVVFSPPYANCFDYLELYKLELWMGGFVNSYADFHKYRSQALRSHVNASFDHTIKNSNRNVDLVAETISCFNVWNKNIPDMVRGYFDDMTEVFKILHRIMEPNSKCFIIVANSAYRGVLVPTDLLLTKIAGNNGFSISKILIARRIRASSQQMKELYKQYGNLTRESVVVLERK